MNKPTSPRLRVRCPLCQAQIEATSDKIGQTVTCDVCLEEFAIAGPEVGAGGPSESSDEPLGTATERALDAPPENGFASAGEDWLELDDDPSAPDDSSSRPRPRLTENYQFSAFCPLCGTLHTVTDDRIGRRVKCPDCYTQFEIRTPPFHARRPRTSRAGAGDQEEFKLSDAIEPPRYEPMIKPIPQSQAPASSAPVWRDRDAEAGGAWLAAETLRKAEEEAEKTERGTARLPARPLTSGIFAFLLDGNALLRLVLLAVALNMEIGAIQGALARLGSPNPLSQFMCGMLFAFALAFGWLFFTSGAVSMLAIAQETAAGRHRVEDWPPLNLGDWFFESLHVLTALFLAIVPGLLLGQAGLAFGGSVYAFSLAGTCLLTGLVLFPVVLLANLETGSAFNPASGPVFRSLVLARGSWLRFYVASAALVAVAGFAWQLRRFDTLLGNLAAALAVVAITMIYFRLLGRLAWVCQETDAPQ